LIGKFGVDIRTSQLCLFAFLAAVAVGTVVGGGYGDKYGRKRVIWISILGAAPFALFIPYVGLWWAVGLAVVTGFIISSAFSAILVYATELKPYSVGMIAGIFFGLNFGLGGIGSAFFGWLADRTSIEFVFRISTLLPLLGLFTAFLPDVEERKQSPSR
ncbi:MAG: MFS transporter, partial [Duncaniella sp.]|nr:MFS transporter [Duncaniella sp.]